MKRNTLRKLVFLFFLIASVATQAQEFTVDGVIYCIDNSQEVWINGYTEDIPQHLIIPEIVNNGDASYHVTAINAGSFENCKELVSITIPNNIIELEGYTFEDCINLSSVTLPDKLTKIHGGAFMNCKNLTSITIPSSVTEIGTEAFWGTGLTSINIPNNVSSVIPGAFSGCRKLETIMVESGNKVYDSRNNCNAIIETESNKLITGCQNTIIPNGVTCIEQYAFCDCSNLNRIIIPSSVNNIMSAAFFNCYGLTSIQVESGNKVYDSRNNCNAIIETKTSSLILGCPTTIIPNSVKNIGTYAFANYSDITSISIPNSVKLIYYSAFSGCRSLQSIVLPQNLGLIANSAFTGCSGIKDVYCYAEDAPQTNITFYNHAFSESSYTEARLHVPASSIEKYRNASVWNEFKEIVALTDNDPTPTGVKHIHSDNMIKKRYYSLDGKNYTKPQRGLNIIHQSNGTNKKLIMK